ncbi:MAG TPA: GAF domain-containing protein [Chloroflexota bacterium]|nr:GAF domain-containing protein [Chloroflexota bacterium]HUM70289.1 GAF domain-containing protein [Chloroflexota bacterium]
MLNKLNQWLITEQVSETIICQQKPFVHNMLVGMLVANLLGIPISLAIGESCPNCYLLIVAHLSLEIILLGALWLLQHGRFQLSIFVMVNGFLVAFALYMLPLGAQNAWVFIIFVIPITLAGLLLRRRALLSVLGICILMVAGLILLPAFFPARYVTSPLPDISPIVLLSLFTLVFSLATFFLDRFSEALRTALAKTTRREEELAHNYAILEQEIVERQKVELRLRQSEHFLAQLNDITHAALSAQSLPDILQTLADRLSELFAAEDCFLTLWDEKNRLARAGAASGLMRDTIREVKADPGEMTITESVLMTGHALLIDDVHNTPYISAQVASFFPNHSLLGLPLIAGGHKMGAAIIVIGHPREFSREDVARGEQVAAQIALAIVRMQLLTDAQLRVDETETLRQAGAAVASTLERDEIVDLILQQLARVVPYTSASVQLLDDDHLEIMGGRGWSDPLSVLGMRFPIPGDNPNTIVIQEKRPYVLTQAPTAHKPFQSQPHDHIRSWLGVPLIVRDRVMGMIAVDSDNDSFFTSDHIRLVSAFADQVAITLENARLFVETRRQVEEQTFLVQTAAMLRTAVTTTEIATLLAQKAAEVAVQAFGSIFLLDSASGDYISQGWFMAGNEYRESAEEQLRHHPGQGITGHVALTGQVYMVEDLHHDPIAIILPDEVERLQTIHSGISLPLQAEKQVIGVLHVWIREKRKFTESEVRLLSALAEMAGSALHRAVVLETLEERVRERTAELSAANARLRELDWLKSKFVSDVSHELRTPVTNLQLYLDLLGHADSDKHDKYLSILQSQTNRLRHLIERILDLSRLDKNDRALDFALVDLNEVLQEVVIAHEPQAIAAGLELRFEPAPSLPLVPGNQSQLIQVASNLVANAIHYTPSGFIHARTMSKGQQVCFEVEDTGVGISPEERPYIFDRFYRGERVASTNIPGTGLGLAIVQEIVEMHGGQIEVENRMGCGTIFRVCLKCDLASN